MVAEPRPPWDKRPFVAICNADEAQVEPYRDPEIAYAVRNDQGYWVGIWNDRSIAEQVCAKGQPSHNQKVVEVVVLGNHTMLQAQEASDE